MCGIVGYIGSRRAEDVLLDGLRRLEYRGYDSSGAATLHENDLKTVKAVGKVALLADALSRKPLHGSMGIAHTRWATHGEPTNENAHPHVDCRGTLALVHNGIIENYAPLKRALIERGHQFRSDTDTEVLAHLMEDYAQTMPFEDAFFATLKDVVGTFGVAVISTSDPRKIFAARRGSPLVVGLGTKRDEFFLASDPSAILTYTRDVIYLDDDEAVAISADGVETFSLERQRKNKPVEKIEWSLQEIERGRHAHFMLKEIYEQPEVIIGATRGRLDAKEGRSVLGGLRDVEERLRSIDRLTIVACGSAYLAGTVGQYMLEEYADIPTKTELGSEFRYRKPIIDPKREAVIAVSQSGETADTLGALREAKSKGALALGIVNVVGSTVARDTDAGVYTHAGPEIAVASTKAFLAQLTVFSLLTLYLGRQRRMSQATGARIVEELALLPKKIERIIAQNDRIKALAKKYAHHSSALYLGRKYNAPVAYEGALKLKEIAYIHAEGYAAGEMKHGPIALLDSSFPIIAIVPRDSVYEKMKSNIEEARARHAPILAIASEGDEDILRLAEDVIYVPRTIEMLSPILNVIPLQLFAYHVAVARGYDPDKPRNLAKSVTVE
ncbi:MAG TPA: glutamine--fructose-6-phosphate transaminase (isomerizing) [Candidatus Eisenbacteria bacterium]|jgi:glucosamine--fructose-6-phosphate aminotransferase (isomerizing)|nr:glutamine--fructose-6-phosphate transaminase (isomerizing) [Candidatus Eisenbacteria bacterium]